MLWGVMFLYSLFGKQYKRSATDSLFADGILNILSIPIAAWFLEPYEKNASMCGDISQLYYFSNYNNPSYSLNFGLERSRVLYCRTDGKGDLGISFAPLLINYSKKWNR
jgi:hypothetical protein